VSDLVKIKHGGLSNLKSKYGGELGEANSGKYHGGYTSENIVNSMGKEGYNRGFKRDYDKHNPSLKYVTTDQIPCFRFPPDRTF